MPATMEIPRVIFQHTIGDILRRTARRYPDKPAILCGDIAWTYAEFDQISNRLAHGLAAKGVALGDRIAILSRNSHAFAAMRFALAKLGAVLVPINFMLNADEIAFILRSSGAKALAVGPDFVELGRAAAKRNTTVEKLFWLTGEEKRVPPAEIATFDELLSDDATQPDIALDNRMLAQIVYTSGTESSPKGAMLTHEAILWEYVSCVIEAEFRPHDVMLHAMPMYHCAQLDVFLGPAIYVGMTNIITGQPKPEIILPLLAQRKITAFFAPPSIWIALLRSPLFDQTDLSALRKGYYGAAIMPVEVMLEISRRLPNVRLWNLYGQTEIAPLATMLGPDDQLAKPGSAGKPVINVETRVVDDDMNDVAPGEIGEIVHRSPQLMAGYFNDPEKTTEAFSGGWFHSGDLATIDAQGNVSIVDRKKDMIKTGGENVASREVEEMIYRIDGVSEVAAIGLPDPYWIEIVTAVIVPQSGAKLDEAQVIEFCRANMAHFKAPKRVIFTDSLPKNPSGKVLKRDLRTRY